MNHHDILFIGHMAVGTVVPFGGSSFVERGSPVLFASIAASRVGKRISAATKIPEGEEYLLEPMRAAGIDLNVRPGGIIRHRIVFPSANVDERQTVFVEGPDEVIAINDTLPFEPCLVHLCWIGPRKSQLDLMRALKARGFRLSVDMQNFMFQADEGTGIVHFEDIPEKKEILSMADFVKLDAVEAIILTGADDLQDQAEILKGWGSSETIITCSEGVLVQNNGKSSFAKFVNRSNEGRMGRGDTFMGAYLARRLDYSAEESLRFAAALTSIKLESPGPFVGSVQDVIERMRASNKNL
jgi:sugar/nucleoside kinase (ribokinase family)